MLLLGIVFDVVIILFITISVLLIYSLLMSSVEAKTFENGVLRMVGTSNFDSITVILFQSLIFVVPSLILAYILSLIINYLIYA